MFKRFTEWFETKYSTDYPVYFFILVFIFGFLYFTGTLTSGYHFVDDHWILKIGSGFRDGSSFFETVIKLTHDDLSIRFRPLYYLYYVFAIKLFSQNFLGFSIFVGALSFLTVIFFYSGLRRIKFSIYSAIIFVSLIFIGPQFAVWWRLGTNETVGIFFLGLSFYFMTRCLSKSAYKTDSLLFVIFLIVSSLCKESFILVVPALLSFKVLNEQQFFGINFRESLRNNVLLVLPLIVMLVELFIIKFIVGSNQIGYAGMISSYSELVSGVENIVLNPLSLYHWMTLLGCMFLIYGISILFLYKYNKREIAGSLRSLSLFTFISLLIIVPQIFMHAKSGMIERYLLPTTLGLSLFVVGILKNIKPFFLKTLAILLIVYFVYTSFGVSKREAIIFAESGRSANLLLSTVRSQLSDNSSVLLVVDPVDHFEISHSIKTYLSFFGFNKLYAYPMSREYESEFERGLQRGWEEWFNNREIGNIMGKPDLIIIFDKNKTDAFMSKTELTAESYKNILPDSSSHVIYRKK